MASNSHHNQHPSITMSYSQSSIGSANGLPTSQSHMGSFNASQSVASTPAATPPRSSQHSMSFSMPNGLPHNSMSRSSFGGYEDANGYGAMVPYQEPQIYKVGIRHQSEQLRC